MQTVEEEEPVAKLSRVLTSNKRFDVQKLRIEATPFENGITIYVEFRAIINPKNH